MKKLLLYLIGFSIISCKPTVQIQHTVVDRTSPQATAIAILSAYQAKDIYKLKELSTKENVRVLEALTLDSTLIESRGIFDGWRWTMVNNWDGTIKDARIEMESRTMYMLFYEPENSTPDSEVGVLSMDLENEVWCFVDILSPDKKTYETLFKVESMNN